MCTIDCRDDQTQYRWHSPAAGLLGPWFDNTVVDAQPCSCCWLGAVGKEFLRAGVEADREGYMERKKKSHRMSQSGRHVPSRERGCRQIAVIARPKRLICYARLARRKV